MPPVCLRLRGRMRSPDLDQAECGLAHAWRNAGGIAIRYEMSAECFASHYAALRAAGASFVGGCCGSTPDFIRALVSVRAQRPMRLKLISCEVLFREMCDACAHSPHQVDLEFLPKGLHDLGRKPMAARLQEAVDRTPECRLRSDPARLWALRQRARRTRRAAYAPGAAARARLHRAADGQPRTLPASISSENPGTYYRSTGWLERGQGLQQLTHDTVGFDEPLEAMIRKYGEDNGRYLYEELTRYRSQYRKLDLHRNGIGGGRKVRRRGRRGSAGRRAGASNGCRATWHGCGGWWTGDWPEAEFAIAEPGQCIAASYDNGVLKVQP